MRRAVTRPVGEFQDGHGYNLCGYGTSFAAARPQQAPPPEPYFGNTCVHNKSVESALSAPAAPARLWLWPNLLSLDAPVVAVLWQFLFARCFQAPVDALAALLLLLTVWLIYGLTGRWMRGEAIPTRPGMNSIAATGANFCRCG